MKKKILTLVSIVLVMTVSAVMLVACAAGPLTMGDLVNEDGTINSDKITSNEVTVDQWTSATSVSILDKDLAVYMKMTAGELIVKSTMTIDGKKIKQDIEMGLKKETVYLERLEGVKANEFKFKDEKWISTETEYDAIDIFANFQIGQLTALYSDATYDAESNQYTIKNSDKFFPNSIATVKFSEGNLTYFKLDVEGKTFAELVLLYEDATVTLPVVA